MSLGEALRNLDPDRTERALASSVLKVVDSPGDGESLLRGRRADYPQIATLPNAMENTLKALSGDGFPQDRLDAIRAGATILALVFTEYAGLEDLENCFPDVTA